MTPPLHAAVLNVLRRAHPRPLTAAVIGWHVRRDPAEMPWDNRSVIRALEYLRRDGQVRRVQATTAPPVYGLAPPACRVCGRDVGNGGTCGSCGEAA